jgi:hypothetical protein
MGCDIHGVIQIPLGGGTAPDWVTVFQFEFIPRDYRIFGKLAGVRGIETPVVSPRGIPTDWQCSNEDHDLHECPFDGDAHTPTWLHPDEYRQVLEWYREQEDRWPENDDLNLACYEAIGAALDALHEIPARLVVWFDN